MAETNACRNFPLTITRIWERDWVTLFLKFVTETLKQQIDATIQNAPDRLNTGMGGSSVGGLLSMYAALMYPNVFGRLMIFSPSLWISRKIYFDAIHFFEPFETRIYLYGGGQEGSEMVPNITNYKKRLPTRDLDIVA